MPSLSKIALPVIIQEYQELTIYNLWFERKTVWASGVDVSVKFMLCTKSGSWSHNGTGKNLGKNRERTKI